MNQDLYSTKSNLVIAFHGCDNEVFDKVIHHGKELNSSHNDYDWLGSGIYFWESNYERALQWAEEHCKRGKKPAVIGAVLDLGYCLDLTQSKFLQELAHAYDILETVAKLNNIPLPENKSIGNSNDKLLRRLDCAVIETVHTLMTYGKQQGYDSVRGVFWEGKDLYPNAGFKEKNHIQISIRNPNCIKGYFAPKAYNKNFPNP